LTRSSSRSGRRGKRRDLARFERPPGSDLQVADGQIADACARQFQNLAANSFDHAANLTVAAFGDCDLKVRIFLGIAHAFDACGARWAVTQFHAAPKLVEGIVGNRIGALDQISFRDFVIGIRQALGKLRIVSQDQQAAGVKVEASDGRKERIDIGDEVIDGGAAFGIFECREVAGRLVEQDVESLFGAERLVIEENFVALEIDPVVGILDDAAVDFDAAGVNPAARLGARANARLGESAFERFRACHVVFGTRDFSRVRFRPSKRD